VTEYLLGPAAKTGAWYTRNRLREEGDFQRLELTSTTSGSYPVLGTSNWLQVIDISGGPGEFLLSYRAQLDYTADFRFPGPGNLTRDGYISSWCVDKTDAGSNRLFHTC
jgi:hypothetical protein